MKKVVSLFLAFVMIFALVACGSSNEAAEPAATAQTSTTTTTSTTATTEAAETSIFDSADAPTYVLKGGHVQTTTHPYHLGMQKFADLLEERSNGKITLEVYPSSQLGGERDLTESVQMGSIDCAVVGSAILASFDPRFEILSLPFVFENREHAYKIFESSICEELYASCESSGIVGLGWYENGFFDVLSKDPVNVPDDIKGKNIRTMESTVYMNTFTSAGANPVPMAFGEVYTALQNGTIDGVSTSVTASVPNNFQEVAPYFCIINMNFTPTPLIFSKEVFDGMPEEYQALIKECGIESEYYEWEQIQVQEAEGAEAFAAAGGAVTTTTDRQAWIDKIADYVYSQSAFSMDEIDAFRNFK